MNDFSNYQELDEIFTSIDKKLSENRASDITDEEIQRVFDYYSKEKHRFNLDQSQFIKPTRRSSKKAQDLIDRLAKDEIEF